MTGRHGVTPAEPEIPTASEEDQATTRMLLTEHVPISLIMDMASPIGPDSKAILNAEGEPEDHWWEPEEHDAHD